MSSVDDSWSDLEDEAGTMYTNEATKRRNSSSSSGRSILPSMSGVDPAKLAPMLGVYGLQLAQKNGTPDYLFPEQKERSMYEKMSVNCGASYAAGAVCGGLYGTIEGLKSKQATNSKLRLNAILNGAGKRGTGLGNSLAIVALFYTCIESGISSYRDRSDVYSEISAAALTGAIYKSSRGVKAATVAGILGGGVLGVLGGLRNYIGSRGGSLAHAFSRFQ